MTRTEANSKAMTTVEFGIMNEGRKIELDMNFDHWKQGEPKYDPGYDYACLDIKTSERKSCKQGARNFFCAKYLKFEAFTTFVDIKC